MNSSAFKTVATDIVHAGAPALPTMVLARELPLYEVEVAGLEFAEEESLPAADWAVLALARALGEIGPADIDAYLGVGDAVAAALQSRLLDEALLQEQDSGAAATEPAPSRTGVIAFFRRLFGAEKPGVETPRARTATAARKLAESTALATPICVLSPDGSQALDRGVVARRRTRSARLLFAAEPLLFLEIIDEKRHRFSQHRRPRPLGPGEAPMALRTLDVTLGLPAEARLAACGVGAALPGFQGRLVGITPGTQWEIRPHVSGRGDRRGLDTRTALLILGGFPSPGGSELAWSAFVRVQDRVQDVSHLDATSLIDASLRAIARLPQSIDVAKLGISLPTSIRTDGALDLCCDAISLPRYLGDADRPEDAYLSTDTKGWWVGLRAHARPVDSAAARAAFFELLSRHDSQLRRQFDATCTSVAASLHGYWGEVSELPSVDEVARILWERPDLRAALCMRRMARDLVEPYLPRESAR